MNLECPIINVIEMILRSKLCFFEGVMFKRTKISAKFKEGKPRNGQLCLRHCRGRFYDKNAEIRAKKKVLQKLQ